MCLSDKEQEEVFMMSNGQEASHLALVSDIRKAVTEDWNVRIKD